MDWESCSFARVRGRTAIVITVRTSTSLTFGTLPMNASMLERSRLRFGFEQLSRGGRVVSDATCGTVVLTSAGLVLRTQAADLVATFGDVSWPGGTIAHEVELYVLVAPPRRLKLQEAIQYAASRRLVLGSTVRVVDLRAEGSRPEDLGVFASADGRRLVWPPSGASVIIDQNFLVRLDRCLNQQDAPNWSHIREMMAWMSSCDTIPGFALAECRFGKDGAPKVVRLRAALKAFEHFQASPATWHTVAAKYRELASSDVERGMDRAAARPELIGLNYLGVLRAAALWGDLRGRRWNGEQRVNAWESWVETLNQDGVGLPAYCLATVLNLFLGNEQTSLMAEKQLKLVRAVKRKDLLGAAWDLTYLTIADMARAGLLEETGSAPVVFLTADKPLLAAASSANLVGMQVVSGLPIGVVATDVPVAAKLNEAARARMAAIALQLRLSQSIRAASPTIDLPLINAMIDRYEQQLQTANVASWYETGRS